MPDGMTAEVRRDAAIARREREPAIALRESDRSSGSAPQVTQRPGRRSRRKLLRYSLFAVGGVVLIAGGLWYWVNGGRYIESDDAYVQGNVLTVSTDVSGVVDTIPVKDGQHVQSGQVLFRLDPLKFQLAVDQAQANVGQTRLNLDSLKAQYDQAQRQVIARAALVKADQATYDRYAVLVKDRAITEQQYDDIRYKLQQDQAAVAGDVAAAQAILARLGGRADIPIEQMPAYKQAEAQLGETQRELNHSIVRAPFNGDVTQVSKLQPGQFLPAGTAAFGLVQTQGMWVAAQPKETQLTYARDGQPVTVTVDTYPGHTWHGTVQSIAPATDQEFSVLPAQNSSGNWVKVVQRLPVRITLQQQPGDPPLSAGMSADVSIDTGHERHLSDLF